MKIAFHVPRAAYLEARTGGGDPVVVHSLLDALSARGHELEVVSRLDARALGRGRVPMRRLPTEALAVRKRMRRFAPDAWLVYGPAVTYPDFFGWWLRPRRYVLYTGHRGKPKRLPRRRRWLFAYAHRRSLARADEITVIRPGSTLRREAVERGRTNVHVLVPAAKGWSELPARDEARARLGLPSTAPVVLCLARFPARTKYGKTEMALTLVRMLPRLEDAVLLLVGDDGPGLVRVQEEISSLGLHDRVRLLLPDERRSLFGGISNEDAPWFYAAADVYAYPHPLDAPWLSLSEAQACGRAVVTMRTESAALVVRDGVTGRLARDEDELAAHLAPLLADRERCDAMGRAAAEHFREHLSLERHLDRLEELLQDGAEIR